MSIYNNSSYSYMRHDYCNETLHPYVRNLTSSYADKHNESTMVATSVAMFLLAALFFNVNLFSRFSTVSAVLNPTVRVFLSISLALFLPVMSYLFSEAKSNADDSGGSTGSSQLEAGAELSLRARTILMWMLLVELLRKKVEEILVNVGMQWYSSTIDRAARIAWLGYLVFNNVKSTGKKVIYGTIWVLAASKLVQRVVINEVFKRSFAYGKNAQLLDSYMAELMLVQEEEQLPPAELDGSELLKRCRYAVKGEDSIEKKAGPEGYRLKLKKMSSAATTDDESSARTSTTAVTVGDIWRNMDARQGDGIRRDEYQSLKRLCLSFALYKLLRRRFEDFSITAAETRDCRNLIFKGLHKELLLLLEDDGQVEDKEAEAAAMVFQVFGQEIQFLSEYYHSVLPVVLSSPFFFVANYILFPIVVWGFCLLTFLLCGNGNAGYTFQSISGDNYIISTGAMTLTRCLLWRIRTLPEVLFSTIDLSITLLLMLTFIYEQVWEFLVFILSNWLMVSLLCQYSGKPEWRYVSRLIRCILWVRSKLSLQNLCFKQFSVLWFPRPMSMLLPTKAVPKGVKKSILEYLVIHVNGGHRGGSSILLAAKHARSRAMISSACGGRSCAEVILICHIATSLVEVTYSTEEKKTPAMGLRTRHRKVATALSKYCAYLVALYPELLPEDRDWTRRTFKETKEGLKKVLGGCVRYHLSRQQTRYEKLMEMGGRKEAASTISGGGEDPAVLQRGAKLGRELVDRAKEDEESVWELLADLWTELMVYVAPSSGELHVKAHKDALAQGGEFVTVLWAMATHTGITRPAVKPWDAVARDVEDEATRYRGSESV